MTPGNRTALVDGMLMANFPKYLAIEEVYKALASRRLHLCKEGYVYAVVIFSLKREPSYIYSYDYQLEENRASLCTKSEIGG